MNDIEVKRKELETAKRIRDNAYSCFGLDPVIGCASANCPALGEEWVCKNWTKTDWDAFISTREAELAEMEKTPQDGLSHEREAPRIPIGVSAEGRVVFADEAVPDESVPADTTPDDCNIKTIDDFAIALIQGGYYAAGNPNALYVEAERIKAESDRRRAEY